MGVSFLNWRTIKNAINNNTNQLYDNEILNNDSELFNKHYNNLIKRCINHKKYNSLLSEN